MPWTTIAILVFCCGFLLSLIWAAADRVWALFNALPLLISLIYFVVQGELDRRKTRELDKLKTAYQALDDQAKLIIKTDMALNRAQEELDKKITGLMTLHQWNQRSRVLTAPDALLQQFDEALMTQLGYDKGWLFIAERSTLAPRWSITPGYRNAEHRQLTEALRQSTDWPQLLALREPLLLNQPDAKPGRDVELLKRCGVSSLIIVPVPLKDEELCGVVAAGHEGLYAHVSTGDQDILSLLAAQLATDLENARLYHQAWESQHVLELRVQERTRELERANQELQRLNRAKSDFVNAVAHELRTPLTSIKGYASILRSGQLGPIDPAHAERLTKIDKHSDDLTQLINDLLDISRIESGKVAMEPVRIPVPEFVRELDDLVRPLIDSRQLQLVCRDGDVEALWADRQQLKRVFMNLLSNAIKYTPARGTITLTLAADGAEIHASVSDTGAGIEPADLPHLFEEFYRAKTTMNAQIRGTGLGLTLVRRIVEAHGGKIWAESTVGHGSTFHVVLPRPPAQP